jgi:hypothetical protein
VIHTRVSEQLSDDIRKFAEDLRVPASNLVRNVLEEVFTMVDSVSDDVGDLFDDLLEEAEGVRERVRNQAESQQRRTRRRSRGGHWGRSRRSARNPDEQSDTDVEAELRQDEASESKGTRTRTQTAPGSDSRADSADTEATESKPRAADLFPDILGWQPLVLNRDFACGRCERDLKAGESAFLGLGEKGLTQTALCGRCAGSR